MLLSLLPLAGWANDAIILTPYKLSKTYGTADADITLSTAKFGLDPNGTSVDKDKVLTALQALENPIVRVEGYEGETVGTVYYYTFPETLTIEGTEYDVEYTQSGQLTINRKAFTITATAANKTYDGTADLTEDLAYSLTDGTNTTWATILPEWDLNQAGDAPKDGLFSIARATNDVNADTYGEDIVPVWNDNDNYTVTINKAAYTINPATVGGINFGQATFTKTFGEGTPNWGLALAAESSLVGSETIADNFEVKQEGGSALSENKGNYTVKVFPKNGNYTITTAGTATYAINGKAINAASISINQIADKEYAAAAIELTTGDLNSELVVKDGETLLVKDQDYTVAYSDDHTSVGPVTVTITGTGNYETNAETTKTTTFAIVKRAVTVTASHAAIEYGDDVPTDWTINYSGFYGGDQAAIITGENKATASTNYTKNAVTGEYKIEVDVTGLAEHANYRYVKGADGVLTVTGTSVATADVAVDLTYTAAAQTLTAENTTVTVGDNALTLNTDYEIVGAYTEDACTHEATLLNYGTSYYVKIKGIGTYSGEKVANFTLKKQTVTIAAVDDFKYYGDSDAAWEAKGAARYIVTGLKTGAELTTAPTVARVAGTTPDNYTITVSAAAITPALADNYAIVYETGTFEIKKRPITFYIDNKSKVYGEVDPELTYTQEGLVSGETINTVTLARATGNTVNTYAITGTAFTTNQNTEAYYEPVFQPGVFTINKANLTIKAKDQAKTFGTPFDNVVSATTVEFGPTIDEVVTPGLVNGETINDNSVNITLTCTETSIGQHTITLTATSDNYIITPINGELNITAGAYVQLNREDAVADVIEDNDGNEINVTFGSRALTGEKWNAFVLPFDITVAKLSQAFGYAIFNVLNTTTTTRDNVHFRLEMQNIPANTPFLMKTAGDVNTNTVQINGVTISKPEKAGEFDYYPTVGEENVAQFVGVYKRLELDATQSFPANAADADLWKDGTNAGVYMNALGAYLKKYNNEARVFIEDIENGTTVIKELNMDTMKALSLDGWYTLNGVKLQGAPTEKGIYINNGKKVVVK